VQYVALFAIVLAINLLPAFGPPTWTVLVFTRLHWHLDPVALVVTGAIAATVGRYLLARLSRHFRGRLPGSMRANLADAQALVDQRRVGALAIFGLFVVSPLPSAQLFVAAGLLEVPLVALSVAFLVGRLVSYTIYVSIATLADRHLGGVVANAFGSPWSIGIQVALLVVVCLLPLVRWRRFVHHDAE